MCVDMVNRLLKTAFFLSVQEIQAIKTVDDVEAFMLKHGENIVDSLGAEVDRIETTLKVRFSGILCYLLFFSPPWSVCSFLSFLSFRLPLILPSSSSTSSSLPPFMASVFFLFAWLIDLLTDIFYQLAVYSIDVEFFSFLSFSFLIKSHGILGILLLYRKRILRFVTVIWKSYKWQWISSVIFSFKSLCIGNTV